MDLHRLAVFVKVYELKSLSRSAEAVYLSQPTVSGHLKGLEQELGVRLFDRLSRGVTPTAAADLLYDYARRLLALRDEALAAVTGLSGQVRGRLLVGGSTIPGQYLLPVHLAELRRRYPELEVSLAVAGTAASCQAPPRNSAAATPSALAKPSTRALSTAARAMEGWSAAEVSRSA